MESWSFDEDTLIAFACGLLAVGCAWMAVRGFRQGAIVSGAAWSAGALAFGFVAWFFATFTMRMM